MRLHCLAPLLPLLSLLPTSTLATPVTPDLSGLSLLPILPTPIFTFDQLWQLTNSFWTAFMYPNNVPQTQSINSTIFADNVLGRVDVSRNFNGRELNTEYIFGLFSQLRLNPHYFSLLGIPTGYNITHFTANQNVVSCAVIINFYFKIFGITTPVEIDVWFTFNSAQQISQYDATFRWLDWQVDYLLGLGEQLLGVSTPAQVEAAVASLLATSICEMETMYCNGTNQQYANGSACYNYLTQKVRFGTTYQLGMNTLLCRMVHQNMVPFRPDVHCSHIGPTGGAYCVDDLTYSGVVLESIFTNTPFVPFGYQNKNATIAAM